jgi:hypothetical protein
MKVISNLALCAPFLVACAHEPTMQRMEESASAVRAAEEVGARKQPVAALHLQLAKEQMERAQKMIKDGDRENGEMMLVRAEADADLAVALSRTAQEQADAQGAVDKVRQLKMAPH